MPAWISWLFPEQASTLSSKVDALFLFMIVITGAVALLVFLLVTVFVIRYRRTAANQRGADIPGALRFEVLWSIAPLFIFMGMFLWGAVLYFQRSTPPPGSLDIYVVARQWMWKLQHLEGTREINELHIPVGVPVRLIMTSQDVIHSFFVPAFRIKQDVLPGRYTTQWFQATKPGRYHLFCAEYCGNQHSKMEGWVYVMSHDDYQNWLDSERLSKPMKASGEKLFNQLGCNSCHGNAHTPLGPPLNRLYGSSVPLADGGSVVADDSYLRESVLNPAAKIARGYKPVMPTYQGQISDEQMNELLEYIKSLKH